MRPGKLTVGALCTLAIIVIAVLCSVGGAWYEIRANHRAAAELQAAKRDFASEQEEVRRTETSLQAAGKAVAAMEDRLGEGQSEAETAVAGPVGSRLPGGAAGLSAARAEGQNFLASFPKARDETAAVGRTQIQALLNPFFKSAGISDAQAQLFVDLMDQTWMQSIVVGPGGNINPSQVFPSADQEQAVLGDQGYQQFQTYLRSLPAQNAVSQFQIAAGYASVPLSADQAAQVAQILENNSPDYANGKTVNLGAVDWGTAMSQIQGALSPEQVSAVKSTVAEIQYNAALNQAMKAASNQR
jgi:hypothetical protein